MWTRGRHSSVDLTLEDLELLKTVAKRFGKSQSQIVGLSLVAFDGLIPDIETWNRFSRKYLTPVSSTAEVKTD